MGAGMRAAGGVWGSVGARLRARVRSPGDHGRGNGGCRSWWACVRISGCVGLCACMGAGMRADVRAGPLWQLVGARGSVNTQG